MTKHLSAVLSLVLILTLFLPLASAQPYPDDLDVTAGGAWLGAGLLFTLFVLSIGALAVLAIVFWFWMLIDCLQREFEDKLVWVFVIVLTGIIGAILYFFLVKRKDHQK
ncbi:MAG: PLDc N-terminal domain-containing protein [Candidatus Aenigmarchaeota archaeon]|nr:PLDc N-terminal domain-containing protein [Candidatus Aenigmarchaeota archaeon]